MPKTRYKRTDKKLFIRQLTRIERREAHLRRLKRKLFPTKQPETLDRSGEKHHHIGISESQYEDIGTFLQSRSGDPAVKVGELIETETYFY